MTVDEPETTTPTNVNNEIDNEAQSREVMQL